MRIPSGQRYPACCLAFFCAGWALLAVAPRYRDTWLHENLLVFAAVPFLVWLHGRLRFTNLSCTLLTIFFLLHLVGAHYSYSDVPLLEQADGRNHYDRVVHFAFGLLLAQPARELFRRAARARGFWSYFFPVTLVMAFSMLYELLEWGFVLVLAPEQGMSFLGTQGDVWDAHKDMALASLGALLAMGVAVAVDARTDPRFDEELRTSLGGSQGSFTASQKKADQKT